MRRVLVAAGAGLALGQAVRWVRVVRGISRYREHWRAVAAYPASHDAPDRTGGALRYVALGDSLAQGIGASHPRRGYVGLLAERVTRATGRSVQVLNLSVTGVLLHDLLRDQLPTLGAVLGPGDLVTVAIGANDAGLTDPAAFRRRFTTLCAALPAGALVADLPDFHFGRRRAECARLSAVSREVLGSHPHLVPVPLQAATLGLGLRERSADLFHPNDRGYRRYAEPFWNAARDRFTADVGRR